jgi:hypothetical protein
MPKKKQPEPEYKSPEYMKALGRRRWKKTTKAERSARMAELARRSHKKNNPNASRDGYHGGRQPKAQAAD